MKLLPRSVQISLIVLFVLAVVWFFAWLISITFRRDDKTLAKWVAYPKQGGSYVIKEVGKIGTGVEHLYDEIRHHHAKK